MIELRAAGRLARTRLFEAGTRMTKVLRSILRGLACRTLPVVWRMSGGRTPVVPLSRVRPRCCCVGVTSEVAGDLPGVDLYVVRAGGHVEPQGAQQSASIRRSRVAGTLRRHHSRCVFPTTAETRPGRQCRRFRHCWRRSRRSSWRTSAEGTRPGSSAGAPAARASLPNHYGFKSV